MNSCINITSLAEVHIVLSTTMFTSQYLSEKNIHRLKHDALLASFASTLKAGFCYQAHIKLFHTMHDRCQTNPVFKQVLAATCPRWFQREFDPVQRLLTRRGRSLLAILHAATKGRSKCCGCTFDSLVI